jgi:glutamine synthetase
MSERSEPGARRMVEADALAELVREGSVDTVVVAFPDLQGRLVGKRVTGPFWLDHVSGPEGIEVCNYLVAVDVDMTPLPGYRFANWEQGYGDVRAVPDLSTIRLCPWIERTALVLCDLADVATGEPVEVSPRQILRRQVERAAAAGYRVMFGAEIELFLFRDSYEEAAAKGYAGLRPGSDHIDDYAVLQTTKDEWLIRQIRDGLEAAGVPVEFSKGEAGRGQHEINLRYAEALEMADRAVVYKNACKEIAALNGRALTFMAKYDESAAGSSCHIHSSLWQLDGGRSLMWDDDASDSSALFRTYLGGLLAGARELSLLFAPFVNSYKRYQPDSWAPTAVAWGHDNRTTGLRRVGHGQGHRIECRIPGADANPYIAFAATIAAGLAGIEAGLDPGPAFEGNGYTATDVPRIPSNLSEAITLFEGSTLARSALGDDVHHHLLNTALQERAAFDRVVTDWERRRNFERI